MKLTIEPKTKPTIKGIILGYSGEGKSSATISLGINNLLPSTPGYELRVLDFDGKYEEMVRAVLGNLCKRNKITQAQHDEALTTNYDICVCRESTSVVQGVEGGKTVRKIGVRGTTTAWTAAVAQLQKWSTSWSDRQILVIDSLTYASRAIASYTQELNNKLNQKLTWRDYQAPQQIIEDLLVICADIPAHVLVLGHQDPLELYKKTDRKDKDGNPIEELMDVLVLPITLGQSGRMKVPAQFNHMLVCASEGMGKSITRYLQTQPTGGVMTKTPFFNAKPKYELETGLVEYFKLRG